MATFREKCSCGAEIEIQISSNSQPNVFNKFRENHIHEMPVLSTQFSKDEGIEFVEEEEDDISADHDVSSTALSVGFVRDIPDDLPKQHRRQEWWD